MGTARATRKNSSDDYAQAARDWADGLADSTGCELLVQITRSTRKGVWVVKTRLVRVRAGRVVLVAAERKCEWPNAEGTSLGAVLLNETIKLDRAELQLPPSEAATD